MRKNKKQNIRLLALILILLLGIGFAALRVTLKIDGTVNVDRTTWDVHFENVRIIEGSVTANPAPTTNNTDTTEMTYTINFTKPGDFFEFTVDIVNYGTIDAMIDDISNSAYQNASSTTPITLPTYLSSTVAYSDGTPIRQNQELIHGTRETIKVRIEFKKDIEISDLPSSGNTSIVFKFKGDYKQADENAESTYFWRLPEGRTKDNLQVGDEICLRDQCFNFLHYDGTNNEDIVMLAKYNLNVGNNPVGTPTNKQNSEAKGDADYGEPNYGTVAFSAENYWFDGNNIKPKYGSAYPYDVYDPEYDTAPDFSSTCDDSTNCWKTPGYSIAYYVKQYKDILSSYGVTIKDARLLVLSEVISIGCVNKDSGIWYDCSSIEFITNSSFWLGTLLWIDNRCIWYMNYGGDLAPVSEQGGENYSDYGVRPVIVISKNNI